MTNPPAAEPLVSVVLIFLNAERFMQETLESVVAQTYTRWELMLVDDGSTDESSRIAQSYAAKYPGQVVYLEHEGHRNRGSSASRNLGIRRSKGKYIAFLDSDDVWLPHKLARQVSIMESEPRAALVYGASRYWHSWTGNPEDLHQDFIPDPGVPTETLFDPPALLTRLSPFGPATTPPPSDFLVRRDALDAIGGFEEEFHGAYQLYDDQVLLVKLYLHGGVFVSGEEWDKYRIHPESCDAAAARAGAYDTIRGFFLNWFQSYLRRKEIRDPAIWSMLRNAVEEIRVQLRTDGGATAELVRAADNPAWARVAIRAAASGAAPDIQVNRPFFELRAGQRYSVRFQAKADRPRGLFVGAAAAHAPWSGRGLYQRIELTGEWRSFELEFTATLDDHNARIHFDMGESDASAELTGLDVRRLPYGQAVEPGLAPVPLEINTAGPGICSEAPGPIPGRGCTDEPG